MKKLILFTISIAIIAVTANAATQFQDDFTVIGGGDVNYQYDQGRQSGTLAPILYNWANGPSTVTNAGPNADTCHMAAAGVNPPAYLNIAHNFTESGDFSIEYEITRLSANNANWDAVSFGTDAPFKYPHESTANYGFEIIFFEHGWYHVYMPGILTGNFYYAELEPDSNATLKIKFVVSQADFSGTGDAQIAMFINDKPYPLINQGDGGTKYAFSFPGGFTNNYINWLTLDTDVNIDNIKITTPNNTIDTTQFTGDGDCGVTNAKVYTHSVNLADTANVVINGQTFTGAGITAQSGANWEIKTADAVPLGSLPIHATYGIYPNVTPASRDILTNVLYATSYNSGGALTLTGLTSGQQYILTLYGMAFEAAGGRRSYIATSDGAAITDVDMDNVGAYNGQLLTYQYTANDAGTFSISTTPITEAWGFYAFSNEEVVPEPAIFTLIGLFGILLLRKK